MEIWITEIVLHSQLEVVKKQPFRQLWKSISRISFHRFPKLFGVFLGGWFFRWKHQRKQNSMWSYIYRFMYGSTCSSWVSNSRIKIHCVCSVISVRAWRPIEQQIRAKLICSHKCSQGIWQRKTAGTCGNLFLPLLSLVSLKWSRSARLASYVETLSNTFHESLWSSSIYPHSSIPSRILGEGCTK